MYACSLKSDKGKLPARVGRKAMGPPVVDRQVAEGFIIVIQRLLLGITFRRSPIKPKKLTLVTFTAWKIFRFFSITLHHFTIFKSATLGKLYFHATIALKDKSEP